MLETIKDINIVVMSDIFPSSFGTVIVIGLNARAQVMQATSTNDCVVHCNATKYDDFEKRTWGDKLQT
jgi:hypothetical protein